MKKRKRIGILFLLMILIGIAIAFPTLKKLHYVLTLFDKEKIVENFRTFDQVWPVSRLLPSPEPFVYPKGQPISLPDNFDYAGRKFNTKSFFEDSNTMGFLVIQNDSIVFEQYYLGHTEQTKSISWSLAKSFISALVGIAIEEGHIKNVLETVDTYVPELKGSAYEGVTIKNILQMSSGVRFNEDYGDFNSDINRWGRSFALGTSQDAFVKTLTREREQGTYNHYVSINTHILGMVLKRATGESVTKYMQEKFWNPVGMEHDSYWVVDNTGMEVVLCALNATLRDYAKIGSVYLNKGNWNGKQIVSEEWVTISTTPDAPHLIPGDNPNSTHDLGYGYQWWIPEGDQGEFQGQGVYNQTIYVNPTTKTVIVKLSANDKFNDKSHIPSRHDSTLELFRAVVARATAGGGA